MSSHKSRLPFDVIFHVIQSLDSDDRGSFYAIAQTCQALSHPALGRLWHTQESITPFLLLLPAEYRVLNQWYDSRSLILSIQTDRLSALGRDTSRLAHMIIYAKRIKRFHGFVDRRFPTATPEAVQFMLGTLPGLLGMDHVFPNLTELRLTRLNKLSEIVGIHFSRNPSNHQRLLTLVSPNLRHLDVIVDNDSSRHCAAVVVLETLRRCRQLRTLSVAFSLLDNSPQQPVVIDLHACFKTPEALGELASLATHSTPIEDVSIATTRRTLTDLVTTPFTVHILGHFRSIRRLSLTLNAVEGMLSEAVYLIGPSSVFPELRSLRLGVFSFPTMTWFLASCASTKIEDISFHFLMDLSLQDITRFFSSLDLFRPKLSHVCKLSVRVHVLSNYSPDFGTGQESHPLFRSMVLNISRLFPRVRELKLKLFPPEEGHHGFLHPPDLFTIGSAFLALEVLKVSTSYLHSGISLRDVVDFSHRFPKLRELGVALEWTEAFYTHLPDRSTPVSTVGSGLQVLKVRGSHFALDRDEEDIVAYLRKHLPSLRSIKGTMWTTTYGWAEVNDLLNSDL